MDLFRLPPPPARYAPPFTKHVPLHIKSLCRIMTRAFGGAKKCTPQAGWRGHKRKRSQKLGDKYYTIDCS